MHACIAFIFFFAFLNTNLRNRFGHVAIQLPSYFERPTRYTRHMHPLAFRQIHTGVKYYQNSFYPTSIVLWNRLPSEVVLLDDLDSFRRGVSKITHSLP